MIRSTRLVDLVNTMDPKLVAAAFGMDPQAPSSTLLITSIQDACPTSTSRGTCMRHLIPSFALAALRRGQQIEQFLGRVERDGQQGLRWIALSSDSSGVTIYLSDVEDVGTDNFFDITEFPPWDPEEETWGRKIAVMPTPEDALHVAERDLAADPQRWVNQGIVCDEYQDFRKMNP
ncbi:hypothetical protein GCM10010095_84760 [Streptomyces anthocyanicus]|uniref:hypothetical protein n=1 Tax=Streptomyces anthocyanicus TaxID=68174 RepID=UPI0019BA8133|nr:hypothetical protein [Streptomyces anthocyanicus]GGL87069.1 hypothetical protein GCM10010095_84760 [Streptomyces anthocyanicus]